MRPIHSRRSADGTRAERRRSASGARAERERSANGARAERETASEAWEGSASTRGNYIPVVDFHAFTIFPICYIRVYNILDMDCSVQYSLMYSTNSTVTSVCWKNAN